MGPGDAVGQHTEIVEEFIEAWHARDIERIVAFLAPDIRYHNMPGEPIDGLPATRAALQGLLDRVSDLRWDIRHIAEAPDGTVLYEKTEHYLIGGDVGGPAVHDHVGVHATT